MFDTKINVALVLKLLDVVIAGLSGGTERVFERSKLDNWLKLGASLVFQAENPGTLPVLNNDCC